MKESICDCDKRELTAAEEKEGGETKKRKGGEIERREIEKTNRGRRSRG